MATRYHVSRHIDAPVERVWALLTDSALSGLITRTIPDMTDSFNQFADGLKTAAEATPGDRSRPS
jgi:hypothetical protein